MSSVILSYQAKVTLIDRTNPIVTPVTIAGDTTGSLGTGTDYLVDLTLTSSGIKKTRNGVLKLRSIDGIFIIRRKANAFSMADSMDVNE